MIGRLLVLAAGAYAAKKAYGQYRLNNPGAAGQGSMGRASASGGNAQGSVLDTATLHPERQEDAAARDYGSGSGTGSDYGSGTSAGTGLGQGTQPGSRSGPLQ